MWFVLHLNLLIALRWNSLHSIVNITQLIVFEKVVVLFAIIT